LLESAFQKGQQADEGDVFGNGKIFGEAITGAVEDECGVGAGSDLL